jgi:hypothetical protein
MTAGGRSQTVTDIRIASPMPGDIRSMKHWKLSKMPTPESPPVIFRAKPCARTGRKKTAESNQHEVLEIIADNLAKPVELGLHLSDFSRTACSSL